jgi:putative phage-type endonuclease
MKTLDLQQGSAQWLAWRREKLPDGGVRIMASDVPTIMGVSPYETAHQLWMRLTGRTGPKAQNFAMRRGHANEDFVRKKLEEQTGESIFPVCCQPEPGEVAPEWAGCSLDGLAMPMDLVHEIKVPGKRDLGSMEAGIVPAHWMAQVQWQLLVTGIPKCLVTAYDPGDGVVSDLERMFQVAVMADPDYQRKLIAEATAFRTAVMLDRPLVGDELTNLAAVWARAYDEVKQAEAVLDEAQKALLAAAPADQARVDTPFATITRAQRDGTIDYAKLVVDMGISEEDVEKYRKPVGKPTVTVRRAANADVMLEQMESALVKAGKIEPADPDVEMPEKALLNW